MYYTDPYSKLCENKLSPFIEERDKVIHDTYQNALFDWRYDPMADTLTVSELKTRHGYNFKDFDEFIINQCKIVKAKQMYPHIQAKFYFWFKNGELYEWTYDPSQTLIYKTATRHDRENYSSLEPHIPKTYLKYVTTLPLPDRICLLN
jgi:hypothetical protein